MIEVPVDLGARSYAISIAPGLVRRAGALIGQLTEARRLTIVADERVAALHLEALRQGLEGFAVQTILVPPGEESKSFAGLERLIDALLDLEITRSDLVVAFGGGVVGDLAGFAAAILKRGVAFIQIPTTLLAMVDSSVGGKTGIDTKAGKNLVGAFHQPRAVLIDPELLQTLPRREMQAGYAEVVKYGLIRDAGFYRWCEENAAGLLAHDAALLGEAIATSCRIKAAVVHEDERETNDRRALLNFGHTFGHALEAECGYRTLLHGEAVAIGMAEAMRFAAARGLAPPEEARRFEEHLRALGMMAWPRMAGIAADAAPRLLHHMQNDKKRGKDGLPFILLRGIGEAFVARGIALADVERFLGHELSHEEERPGKEHARKEQQ